MKRRNFLRNLFAVGAMFPVAQQVIGEVVNEPTTTTTTTSTTKTTSVFDVDALKAQKEKLENENVWMNHADWKFEQEFRRKREAEWLRFNHFYHAGN